MTLTFGSLFSGIGGFDLGFERAGMRCAWQVEIDAKCRAVLKRHFPQAKFYEDVKDVERANLEPVDVVCGGFPCQDLSVAGKRAGLAGKRSGLWFEFRRLLAELKPEWCVIENVPGLLSSNDGRDFAVVLRGLVELGYGVCWRVLDAQYFGVAQRRRRVFVVGHLGDGRAAQILFEPESLPGNPPPRREARKGATADPEIGTRKRGQWAESESDTHTRIESSVEPDGGRRKRDRTITFAIRRAQTSSNGWGIDEEIAHTLDETGGDAVSVDLQNTRLGGDTVGTLDTSTPSRGGGQAVMVAATLQAGGAGTSRPAGMASGPDFLVVNALDASGGGADDNMAQAKHLVVMQDGQAHAPASEGVVNALNAMHEQPIVFDLAQITSNVNRTRVDPFLPASTLNQAGQMHAAGHFGVRRLTPTECERLQGFPDGWTKFGHAHPSAKYSAECARKGTVPRGYVIQQFADSIRYRQLGNAVCVNVAGWIGQRLVMFT